MRILPAPTPLSEPYWDAARDGKLVFQECRQCGDALAPADADLSGVPLQRRGLARRGRRWQRVHVHGRVPPDASCLPGPGTVRGGGGGARRRPAHRRQHQALSGRSRARRHARRHLLRERLRLGQSARRRSPRETQHRADAHDPRWQLAATAGVSRRNAATGQPAMVDDATWQATLRAAIAEVVHKQAEIGVDVISDGEFGKSNWQAYIMERDQRLRGPAGAAAQVELHRPRPGDVRRLLQRDAARSCSSCARAGCAPDPIEYDDAQIRRDIANFKAALAGRARLEEAFMPVIAPGQRRARRREPVLPQRRGVRAGGGRSAEARVPRHRRRRIPAAGRRRDPGQLARPAVSRRRGQLFALGRIAHRGAQLRAARASRPKKCATTCAGAPGTARTPRTCRCGPSSDDPQGQRAGVFVRGGQSAPRARIRGLAGRQATRRASCCCRA